MPSLTRGAQITIAGAAVLVISLFMSWYGVDAGGIDLGGLDVTANAFQSMDLLDIVLLLLGIGAIGLTIFAARGDVNVDAGVLTSAAGALAALIILFRIVDQPGPNNLIGVKYGAFVGLIGALVMAGAKAIDARTR